MARKDFRGGAAKCTASGSVSVGAMSIVLAGDTSGWPTGASSRDFNAIIDRGVAGKMEKVLCSALTAGTLTIASRGADGTTAVTHDAGATVEHGIFAGDFDDLAAHEYDVTRDDHTQYLPADTTIRGFTDVTGVVGSPVDIGTADAPGTADTLSRSDHVHKIPAGFLTTAMHAASSITSALILDGTIATADLADALITLAKFGAGLQPVQVVANTAARPASPTVGMTIYQLDTGELLEYHGATDTWRPPWNTAWGQIVAPGTINADVAHIQGTTLTGLSRANLAMVANRRILVECGLTVNNNAANGAVEVTLKRAGTQVHRFDFGTGPDTPSTRWGQGAVPLVSVAGTATWTVDVDVSVGAGDLTLVAAANRLSWLRITDEGPAGAPA